MRKVIVLAVVCILFSIQSFSQKKIVIMGSSTAAGTGPVNYDNSWARRLAANFQMNMSDGQDTVIENLAAGGQNSYQQMPDGFATPQGRPAIDHNRNVTKALSLSPNVIIINLPTNDIAGGFTAKEFMDNLRTMYSTITSRGVACFITTTQPRHLDDNSRGILRSLVDSIGFNFGYGAIDFYTGIADNTLDIAQVYRTNPEDGIHLNDAAHEILFRRVAAKQLFVQAAPLPLRLLSFTAKDINNSIELSWRTADEEANTIFEIERSGEGNAFKIIGTDKGTGNYQGASYKWMDSSPLNGKNNYRIKIIEGSHVTYSGVVSVVIGGKSLLLRSVYVNRGASLLMVTLGGLRNEHTSLSIVSAAGQMIKTVQPQANNVNISLAGLQSGAYFLVMQTDNGTKETRKFIVD